MRVFDFKEAAALAAAANISNEEAVLLIHFRGCSLAQRNAVMAMSRDGFSRGSVQTTQDGRLHRLPART